jgi:high-affinity Fe2+/Pb2+ permease
MGLGDIFDIYAYTLAYIVLFIVLCHVTVWLFFKKTPVKLDNNSFVVITGACMGIGRQMALEIARLHQSAILVIDRRKDLFDQITQ